MRTHTFAILGYQQSPYLEECIISLKSQSLPSEIILTTSTPNNHLKALAEQYGLAYHINEGKGGSIGSDWNFAIGKANTPLVTLAHQDDVYEKDFTAQVVQGYNLLRQEGVQLIFTDYADLVHGKIRGRSRNALIKKLLLLPFLISKQLKMNLLKKISLSLGDAICCPSVTINKSYLPDFSFDESYFCALDWEAWYRLAQQKGYFIYIPKKLLFHRIHPESETTAQLENGQRSREEAVMFKKIWGSAIAGILSRFYKLGYKDNQL